MPNEDVFPSISTNDIGESEALSMRTPDNINYLHTNKFKMVFTDLPNVNFFCTDITVPSISVSTKELLTPHNNHFVGGNKIDFGDFRITFTVDEDLVNYNEIREWIIGIGAPFSGDQFADLISNKALMNLQKNEYNIFSDATVLTLTNLENYNFKIKLYRMFPYSLDGFDFSNRKNDKISVNASFKYTYFEIDKNI